jgi:hypothetical protein
MMRMEVWAHALAYNLVRAVVARAAAEHDAAPRPISFTGAVQAREAFQPVLALGLVRSAAGRRELCQQLLDAITAHRVGDRPDRFEPRLKKRRKDYCGWFNKPRAELKREMAKGVNKK